MSDLKRLPPSDPIYISGSLHVDQARIAISDLVKDLLAESQGRSESDAIECITLDQAINRILAKDLLSPIDVPVADNSAMDGFAFHGDCLGNSEDIVTLKVVGTAYAGKPYEGSIAPDECLKIMTGALMPPGLDTVVPHKFRNAGQVCVAPTRFIVEDGIYDRFVAGFAQRAKALKVGAGWEDGVQMGPMANERRPEAIEKLVAAAVARGARLMAGGERIGNQGSFLAPTVLADTPLDAEIMNEEPFGPVALVNRYAGEEAMIAEANRLPFGLAAYAWTQDYQRHRRLAAELETGMLAINTTTIGASDAPFGGVKWSGHGHEDGPEGLQACLVTKTIHEG